jgi:predicted ABC-type ATPase
LLLVCHRLLLKLRTCGPAGCCWSGIPRVIQAAQVDFAFETTLAGRSYARMLKTFRQEGYRVVLFFLWLPSVELAVSRVAMRSASGWASHSGGRYSQALHRRTQKLFWIVSFGT